MRSYSPGRVAPSRHSREHHSPGSPRFVQQTEPSNRPHLSQASVIQIPRSRRSLPLCSGASFTTGPVYPPCTSLRRFCRFYRRRRNAESVTYIESEWGDDPSPVVPAILFNGLQTSRCSAQPETQPEFYFGATVGAKFHGFLSRPGTSSVPRSGRHRPDELDYDLGAGFLGQKVTLSSEVQLVCGVAASMGASHRSC